MKTIMKGSKDTGLIVAAVLFLLAGLIQLIRMLTHFSVTINGMEVPLLVNMVALVIFLALSFWLLTLRN